MITALLVVSISALCYLTARRVRGRRKVWRIEQYTRSGHYVKRPNHTLSFVALRLRRGSESIEIEPPGSQVGLDPSDSDFDEKMAEYREAARAALVTIRVNERLLSE